MPKVTFKTAMVQKLLGKKIPLDKLQERIFMIGSDLDRIDEQEIEVEIFPNRPDMLSEQGFARALSAFMGISPGIRQYAVKKSGEHCTVEKTLKMWPYAVTCIVKGLSLDDEKIRDIIQVQEKLAVTFCRNRKKGGLGIYPLDKIHFPIKFTTMPPDQIKFRPLEADQILNGRQILSRHPTGKKYGHIIEEQKEFPVFIDSQGSVLSMPPIVNSHDVGKITESTKDVFLEATGPDLNTLTVAINILATTLADMGGQIYSMEVRYADRKLIIPELSSGEMKVEPEYVNRMLGTELKVHEIKELLQRMGMNYVNGKAVIPAYRADILHPFDIVEDIAIAFGYENFTPVIPKVATIAQQSAMESFKSTLANFLIGLGFVEANTYHLTNAQSLTSRMNTVASYISIDNSVNENFDVVRSWLLPSLMGVLSENTHNELPQKVFEIGRCFTEDSGPESGVRETEKLALVWAGNEVTFTDIKQVFGWICRNLGEDVPVRESLHMSFIPGRAAEARLGGKMLAMMGEIRPEVLESWQLSTPVVALELNVSMIHEHIQNKLR